MVAWMNNWTYARDEKTSPWTGQMSLFRQLRMLKDHKGVSKVYAVPSPLKNMNDIFESP
jgi:sucrose-6-phosphate hydrolase SacC (GH32 family)